MAAVEITGLIRRPFGPVTVLVDGAEWARLPRAVVRALKLKEGSLHEADDLAAHAEAMLEPCARERALLLVSSRERSRGEVVSTLQRDGYPQAVAEEVAERMIEIGAVDDARFASAYARSLANGKGYGRSRVARALREASVNDLLADEALDACCPAELESQRAEERAATLARSCGGSVQRLAQKLVRRGFAPQVAWTAARNALPMGAQDETLPPNEHP